MAGTRANGFINGKRTCSTCGVDCSKRGQAMQGGNLKWRCMRCIGVESDRMVAKLMPSLLRTPPCTADTPTRSMLNGGQ